MGEDTSFTHEVIAKIRELRTGGESIKVIAKMLGVSSGTVCTYVKDIELPVDVQRSLRARSAVHLNERKSEVNREFRDRAIELYINGVTCKMIAAQLGFNYHTILNWVKDIRKQVIIKHKIKKSKCPVVPIVYDFKSFTNTRKRGDAGLGIAIAWFSINIGTVSIPLTDSQDYDLIVEFNDGSLKRVQVKTTSFKSKYGTYAFNTVVSGGTYNKFTKKYLDKTKVDYFFVVTETGYCYLIPVSDITARGAQSLSNKFDKYIVDKKTA